MSRNRIIAIAVLVAGVWLAIQTGSQAMPPKAATKPASKPATGPASSAATGPTTGAASQPTTAAATETTLDMGNGLTMKMSIVPAGQFMMGSPVDEKDRDTNEGPQHEVTISTAFAIGLCPVTREQWMAVCNSEPWKDKDYIKDMPDCPATYISWEDAQVFCTKLSKTSGKTVRLPTEAQWEYACRAGTTTRLSYGDDASYPKLEENAWYKADAWDADQAYPHTVGQKKANPWGIFDMHGNVNEWCQDVFGKYAAGAQTDPQGPAKGNVRVMRGNSFGGEDKQSRSAARGMCGQSVGLYQNGFRVVMVVP